MKRLGLMGGTFDPIHNAHIAIAKSAKKQYNLDEVIFMTGGNPPHKRGKDVTDAYARLEMTRLVAAGEDGFSASDYEVKSDGYSYSAKTLQWLHKKYPNDKIYFLLGEDSLGYIDEWYRPEIIISLCTILVYPRTSADTTREIIRKTRDALGGEIYMISSPVYGISSTDIRERIRNGGDVSGMVPAAVLKYIKDKELYIRHDD